MIHSIANNPTGKEGEAEHTVLCGRARRRDNPRGVLLTEWAYLLWKVKGSVDEARTAFMKNAQWYSDSRHFWQKWLEFELEQPTSAEVEAGHSERIKAVFNDMQTKSRLSPGIKQEIAQIYMNYLQQRGGKDAMKEFLSVDRNMFGYASLSVAALHSGNDH